MVNSSNAGEHSLQYDEPIILIGAGEVAKSRLENFPKYPRIAVDGGVNIGGEFDYVMGDFDSALRENLMGQNRIALDDQNHSDFAKSLAQIAAPVIYGFGFLGGRLDHTLDVLARLSENAHRLIVLIDEYHVAFIWPSGGEMDLPEGAQISFWSVGGSDILMSQGLKWSMSGLRIAPLSMSLSNSSEKGGVQISYEGDPLIALIETQAYFDANFWLGEASS